METKEFKTFFGFIRLTANDDGSYQVAVNDIHRTYYNYDAALVAYYNLIDILSEFRR